MKGEEKEENDSWYGSEDCTSLVRQSKCKRNLFPVGVAMNELVDVCSFL